jgi:hypothetical protein
MRRSCWTAYGDGLVSGRGGSFPASGPAKDGGLKESVVAHFNLINKSNL